MAKPPARSFDLNTPFFESRQPGSRPDRAKSLKGFAPRSVKHVRRITMADTKKCAHPSCNCTVTDKKYCSTFCEGQAGTPDIECECGHASCATKTSRLV